MPGLLGASADFHEATDEGHEAAALAAGVVTGRLGEVERETIRKLGEFANAAVRVLCALGTPEAQAATAAILISLGVG